LPKQPQPLGATKSLLDPSAKKHRALPPQSVRPELLPRRKCDISLQLEIAFLPGFSASYDDIAKFISVIIAVSLLPA
jgi:hypothetical protein